MKSKYCLKSTASFHQINQSHINCSKSKQTFSFCKSPRFQTIQSQQLSYQLSCNKNTYGGDLLERKNSGVSIGRGKRSDFTKTQTVSPGVSKYNLKPLFDQRQNKSKGYSLRMNRQQINFGSYIEKQLASVPPLTHYDNNKKLLTRPPSYSLRSRTKILDKSQTLQAQNSNPGPGYYQNPQSNSKSSYASKFSNISFTSSRSKRFASDGKFSLKTENSIPGPGNYHQISSLSKVGKYVLSNHTGGTKAIFDQQKRVSKFDQVIKQSTEKPGPGTYRMPSEFGQYDGDVYNNLGTIKSSRYSKVTKSRKE